MEKFSALLDLVMGFLGTAEARAGIAAVVLESVLRIVKSEKPLSILYLISGFVHLAAGLLVKLAAVFEKLGGLMDKVLPQRVVAPAEPLAEALTEKKD